eukprot:6187322-Pleurochrysis_carterae.AAC.1
MRASSRPSARVKHVRAPDRTHMPTRTRLRVPMRARARVRPARRRRACGRVWRGDATSSSGSASSATTSHAHRLSLVYILQKRTSQWQMTREWCGVHGLGTFTCHEP